MQIYVALKFQRSAPKYTWETLGGISILNQIRHGHPKDRKCIVTLLDHFKHSGPNGQHVCLVYEYFSENLLSMIKYYDYKGMPLKMVKNICYYTFIGLDYLHHQHFIYQLY